MTLAEVIRFARQGAAFSIVGDDLSTLVWVGPGDAPTQAELDAAMPEAMIARAWDEVRAERDGLLAASDWTQVADAPVDSAAWAVYRQALRDVPQDFASPDEVVWPTAP